MEAWRRAAYWRKESRRRRTGVGRVGKEIKNTMQLQHMCEDDIMKQISIS